MEGASTTHQRVSADFRVGVGALFDAGAWLFGIANNVIRHHWRSEARRLRSLRRHYGLAAVDDDTWQAIDDRLMAPAEMRELLAALETLSTDDPRPALPSSLPDGQGRLCRLRRLDLPDLLLMGDQHHWSPDGSRIAGIERFAQLEDETTRVPRSPRST